MQKEPVENYNRQRSKTMAFRMTPTEESQVKIAIALSGLTRQEYITSKLLDRTIQVQGNCKIHRAVYDLLKEVLDELKRLNSADNLNEPLLSNLEQITKTIDRLYVKS